MPDAAFLCSPKAKQVRKFISRENSAAVFSSPVADIGAGRPDNGIGLVEDWSLHFDVVKQRFDVIDKLRAANDPALIVGCRVCNAEVLRRAGKCDIRKVSALGQCIFRRSGKLKARRLGGYTVRVRKDAP